MAITPLTIPSGLSDKDQAAVQQAYVSGGGSSEKIRKETASSLQSAGESINSLTKGIGKSLSLYQTDPNTYRTRLADELGQLERVIEQGNLAGGSFNALNYSEYQKAKSALGGTGQAVAQPAQPMQPTQQPKSSQSPQGGMLPYQSAMAGLQAGGLQGQELERANENLRRVYQGALTEATASGVQPPTGGPEGRAAIQQYVPPTSSFAATPSPYASDPFMDELGISLSELLSPPEQRKSLTETYKGLLADSGLQALDTELLNMKNVIEGTEDDIRNEVTKAGGFATDSQVMALSNARNKQLVKNYNSLLEARNQKEEYLNTMIGLESKDREEADRMFDRRLNLTTKIMDYKQKMQDNARSTYQKIVDKVGYAGLAQMTGGDPYYTNLVESTLGLGRGGLNQLASLPPSEEDQLDLQLKREQIATEKAQRSKIYSEIDKEGNKKKEALDAYDKSIQKGVRTAETVFSKVSEAKSKVSGKTSGFVGGTTRRIPGTAAYELAKTVDTIQANIGFDTLQAMRDASPTGGALGQVSEREIALLQATVSSLDTGLPEETLRQNLDQVAQHYENWLHTVGYVLTPDGKVVKIVNE